jgi:hypothetical protein
MALQVVDNTTYRPDLLVPGILDNILTDSDFILLVKIITSITENLVKCSCCMQGLRLILCKRDLEKLSETKLDYIPEN